MEASGVIVSGRRGVGGEMAWYEKLGLSEDVFWAAYVATRAGAIVRKHYRLGCRADMKSDGTKQTIADVESNRYINEALRLLFPQDEVIVEESYERRKRRGSIRRLDRVWFADPLDGTTAFLEGVPDFSVIIGRATRGVPEVGVVFHPVRGDLWFAELGRGAYLRKLQVPLGGCLGEQDEPWGYGDAQDVKSYMLRVSAVKDVGAARVWTSKSCRPALAEILKKMGWTKVSQMKGSMKVCVVAMGDGEVFVREQGRAMCAWDLCGPQVILEEAGGRLSDLCGRPLVYDVGDATMLEGVLATNGVLHEEIVARLGGRAGLEEKVRGEGLERQESAGG